MTGRRCTPQSSQKTSSSASRFKTPPHFNLTLRESGNSRSGFKRLKSASHLDLVTLDQPRIRQNLINIEAQQDYETECDLTYSDYLQSLMKQQIAEEVIENHEENLFCQLAMQKDTLFRRKIKCKKGEQELGNLERLKELEELISLLSSNIESFYHLNEMSNLEDTLREILKLLEIANKRVNVKNVQQIQDVKKLEASFRDCLVIINSINLDRRNAVELRSLGNVMKNYQEVIQRVKQKQEFLQTSQKNGLFKLLKSMSDTFAEKNKIN